MKAEGLIEGSESAKKREPAKNNAPALTLAQELNFSKKNDLIDLAKRLGFADEITPEVTKAVLIEFILANQA